MRTILIVGAVSVLTGCMSPGRSPLNTPLPSPEEHKIMATTIECDEPAECDFLWRKAQAWVASHAGMKIQTTTGTVIETYNPTPGTGRMGARIVRLPLTPARSRINFEPLCSGDAFCNAHSSDGVISFKREMLAGR